MRYAKNTMVSSDRSRSEIEKILTKYGAQGFVYGWQGDQAIIGFQLNAKSLKFILPMPSKSEDQFWKTARQKRKRNPEEAHKAWEQSTRQRWRALSLAIKAKLECVESGITSFEQEFLAHIILPSGETVGAWIAPQIEQSYLNKKMPKLLAAF